MIQRVLKRALFITTLFILTLNAPAYAGNIDPHMDGHKYASSENAGWIDFAVSPDTAVTVGNDALTGYIWSASSGWINLSGITNDGNGNLAGYAWGENVGWISFSCSNTGSCATADYGVKITPATGVFSGRAWGERLGWINFDSQAHAAYVIITQWRGTIQVSISGSVVTDIAGHTGLGVRNASVALEGTSHSAVSDSNGNFSFADVQPGDYTLVITSPGLAPIRKQITVSGTNLGPVQMYVYKRGDVTGDEKVGLPEAIHALQIVSGLRSE